MKNPGRRPSQPTRALELRWAGRRSSVSQKRAHTVGPKVRMGPQPASLVSRTAIRPLGKPATLTQLPLTALHDLFRQVTPSSMFRPDWKCSPNATGLRHLGYWSPVRQGCHMARRPGNGKFMASPGALRAPFPVAGTSRSSPPRALLTAFPAHGARKQGQKGRAAALARSPPGWVLERATSCWGPPA
jgi:hypothetical protein